jgi:hypothetical protein
VKNNNNNNNNNTYPTPLLLPPPPETTRVPETAATRAATGDESDSVVDMDWFAAPVATLPTDEDIMTLFCAIANRVAETDPPAEIPPPSPERFRDDRAGSFSASEPRSRRRVARHGGVSLAARDRTGDDTDDVRCRSPDDEVSCARDTAAETALPPRIAHDSLLPTISCEMN